MLLIIKQNVSKLSNNLSNNMKYCFTHDHYHFDILYTLLFS